MTDDETLVAALKAAGHEDAANSLRDKALADQLKAAGHEDVAGALEGKRSGEPEREEAAAQSPSKTAASEPGDRPRPTRANARTGAGLFRPQPD
jgi:hypothetical protein